MSGCCTVTDRDSLCEARALLKRIRARLVGQTNWYTGRLYRYMMRWREKGDPGQPQPPGAQEASRPGGFGWRCTAASGSGVNGDGPVCAAHAGAGLPWLSKACSSGCNGAFPPTVGGSSRPWWSGNALETARSTDLSSARSRSIPGRSIDPFRPEFITARDGRARALPEGTRPLS